MLKKSNILALVGGGIIPKFSKNKIIIYDAHQELIIRQIRFNSNITNVKLRTDSIIGFIKDKIYIIHFNTLETIDIIDIDEINNLIYGISKSNNDLVIGFPQNNIKGKIEIRKYSISLIKNKIEKIIINAHESNIIFITINNEGTLLVSGSEKGQYLRIFNTSNGDLLVELKRGKKAKILSMAFENNSEMIGYISDIGKIYIYDISEIKKEIKNNNDIEKKKKNYNNENNKYENPNKIHEIHKIKEKPFSKFKVNEIKNIIGFIEPKFLVILNYEGKFYKVSYNVKPGKKCLLVEESFLKIVNK